VRKFFQLFSTILLTLSTPIISLADDSSTITIEKMLGKTSYETIIAPRDFQAEGTTNIVKGQSLASGMTLASVGQLSGFSPKTAMAAAGKTLDLNGSLSQIESLKNLSLTSVVAANPEISQLKASAIGWAEKGEKTLGDLAKTDIGNLPLPQTVLSQNSVASFGNIANVQIGQYLGTDKMSLDKLPELAKVPLSKIIPSVASGANVRLMRVNKILVNEQNGTGFASKIVSGSDRRPRAQWDKSSPVSGVELIDTVVKDNSNLANGAIAIIGSSQMIPGGNIPSPDQPTALPVPGTPFAISFESPNAKKGDVAVQLNMRLEYGFGLKTAYFIPIPTGIRVSEASKSTLILMEVPLPDAIAGKQTAASGSSSAPSSPSTVAQQSNSVDRQETSIPSQVEMETAKSNNLGSAVKGSTNPVTGQET
jgi:hypothetical protein